MDGTAIKELKDLALEGTLHSVDGKVYSPHKMYRVYSDPRPGALVVHSLTGVVDYLEANIDGLSKDKLLIHVVNHSAVNVITNVQGDSNERHVVLSAKYDDGDSFPFGRWLDQEDFIIRARSRFETTDDLNFILHHTAKIDTESAVVSQDDGVTQKIQVKRGVSGALTDSKSLKPIVTLKPHRTFPEVEQPESEFLFRMRNDGGVVECALFEADNSAWKNSARGKIAGYLQKTGVAIIA